MNINDRLCFLRKHLGLTTRAFGESINMSGGNITNMEKGTRNITERTIRDICREYNINPDWLLFGKGPIEKAKDNIDHLNIDEGVKLLITQYNLLNDKDKELIKNLILSLSEKTCISKESHSDTPEECEKKFPPQTDENSDVG